MDPADATSLSRLQSELAIQGDCVQRPGSRHIHAIASENSPVSERAVSIIGLGYIGLPTAAAFADAGVSVIGVDVNADAVDKINRGEIHIVEPGLDELVARTVKAGKLRATLAPETADAYLIAVPTPFAAGHQPDMHFVQAAALSIAPVLKSGDTVILESTSPVGATAQLAEWIAEARPDLRVPTASAIENDGDFDLAIAYCPERILPGRALFELVNNDRVIGGMTRNCSLAAQAVYKTFVKGDCIMTNAATAELCKLTENSFRDVNIAFANELSLISDDFGVDVWELISLANRHPRVEILRPGPGVGGHCIAVDPWFIVSSSPENAKIIRCAREVNDSKPLWVIDKVRAAADAALQRSPDTDAVTIACLGLAFKADVDDLRESPALAIAGSLAEFENCEVLVAEPNIESLPSSLEGKATLVSARDAVACADIVVVLVDHASFPELRSSVKDGAIIIDTKGIWTGSHGS